MIDPCCIMAPCVLGVETARFHVRRCGDHHRGYGQREKGETVSRRRASKNLAWVAAAELFPRRLVFILAAVDEQRLEALAPRLTRNKLAGFQIPFSGDWPVRPSGGS